MPFYHVTTLGRLGRAIHPVGLGQSVTQTSPLLPAPKLPSPMRPVTERQQGNLPVQKILAARRFRTPATPIEPLKPRWGVPASMAPIPKTAPTKVKVPTSPVPTVIPTVEVPAGLLTEDDKYAMECAGAGGKWDGRICVFPGGTHGPETTPTKHPIEPTVGPTTPTDIPTAPTPEPVTTPGRGVFTPVTTPPTYGTPSGETVMVPIRTPGASVPPWVEDILAKIDRCCDGGEEACVFQKPGIVKDGCECEKLDDPNSVEGRASRALATYTELAEGDRRAAENWLDKTYSGVRHAETTAAVDWYGLKIEQTIRSWVFSGLREWDFARDWQLCWPVRAKYIRNDPDQNPGGVYLDGANMAIAALYPVRMLSDMAFEIASAMREMREKAEEAGPSGAGSPAAGAAIPPVWPPSSYGGGQWTDSATLKAVLTLANNIIANYLTIMRSVEAKTVRARDTLSICNERLRTGAPSEPTLVSGRTSGLRGCCGVSLRGLSFYVGGLYGGRVIPPRIKNLGSTSSCRRRLTYLGATSKPTVKNRRTDALAYALYYLSRFPAIYVFVPDDPASISEIATTLNRHLEEVVSYTRNLREELRQLTLKIQDCERGIAGEPPPVTPRPPEAGVDFSGCEGTTSATGAVDPDTPISALPDPYAEACVIPGVNVTTLSPSSGAAAAPTTATKMPWGWIAAAIAGVAIAVRGGR